MAPHSHPFALPFTFTGSTGNSNSLPETLALSYDIAHSHQPIHTHSHEATERADNTLLAIHVHRRRCAVARSVFV